MRSIRNAAVAVLLLGAPMPALAQSQPPAPAQPAAAKPPSRAQQLMGDVAPKMAELTDNVLFGDIWERPGLAKRDRSLITVAALIALNRPEQLRSHMALEEIVEAITQLAFYAGWPNAIAAINVARDVFKPK